MRDPGLRTVVGGGGVREYERYRPENGWVGGGEHERSRVILFCIML